MPTDDRALVSRHADGWLLGGFGIVAWLLVSPLPGLHGSLLGPLSGPVLWVLLAIAATHFGASYHLAYGNGRSSLRQHPLALVVTPAVLTLACVAVVGLMVTNALGSAEWLLRALLVVVFTLTGWHYIKQAYGVAMLSLKLHGIRLRPVEVRLLRYGFYPIWFVDLMDVWAKGHRAYYRKYDVGVHLLPTWVEQAGRVAAGAFVVLVVVVLLQVAHRSGRRPPMGAWAPYVSGGLWFVLPPSYLSAAAVIGATHSLQYVACVHRAEIEWARHRGERQLVVIWLCTIGGAMAGGMLVSTWLPRLITDMTPAAPLPGIAATLLFVFLNLHHYVIDATIWRSGGEHVRRITSSPVRAEAAAGGLAATAVATT